MSDSILTSFVDRIEQGGEAKVIEKGESFLLASTPGQMPQAVRLPMLDGNRVFAHSIGSLASLVCDLRAPMNAQVYVACDKIVAAFDPCDPRSRATMVLHPSRAFSEWSDGFSGTPKQLRDWFTDVIGQPDHPLVKACSKIEFESNEAASMSAKRGQDQMGGARERRVANIEAIPELATIEDVRCFTDHDLEDVIVDLPVRVDVCLESKRVILSWPDDGVAFIQARVERKVYEKTIQIFDQIWNGFAWPEKVTDAEGVEHELPKPDRCTIVLGSPYGKCKSDGTSLLGPTKYGSAAGGDTQF